MSRNEINRSVALAFCFDRPDGDCRTFCAVGHAVRHRICLIRGSKLTSSPGWVFTGLSGANDGKPKPPGAWTPEQTVEYMFEKVLEEGDFYVICPDNETTPVSVICRSRLIPGAQPVQP